MKLNSSFSGLFIVATLTIGSAARALAADPDAIIQVEASPRAASELADVAQQTDEVMTVEQATAKAAYYRRQAERYRALGGVGYKAGLVQRAEANAARYAGLAAELGSPLIEQSPRPPEAERFSRLAAQYRRLGAVAYKAGLVQWAEAEQRKYEPVLATETPVALTIPSCRSSKPVACVLAGVK